LVSRGCREKNELRTPDSRLGRGSKDELERTSSIMKNQAKRAITGGGR